MERYQAQQRQLRREATIALAAIVLAAGFLCAVVGWKFGLFASVSTPSPPPITALADLPEYAALQRVKAEREQAAKVQAALDRLPRAPASPTVVRAVDQPSWQSNASTVDYQAPADSPFGGRRWQPDDEWKSQLDVPDDHGDADTGLNADREFDADETVEAVVLPPPERFEPRAFEPRRIVETEAVQPVAADLPPGNRETARVAALQVPVVKRRLVTPFIEDELPPSERDTENDPAAETVIESAPPTAVMVAPGDSFFRLAERVYGDGEFYKALYEHNRHRFRRAGSLPVGATVDTPAAEELQRLYPSLAPPSAD
jgi:nucleoid-associated protein YgaU